MVFKILMIVDERALGEEQGKQEALNMCCRYIEELGRDLKKFGKQKDIRIDVEPLTRIKGWLLKNYILPAERIREIIRKI